MAAIDLNRVPSFYHGYVNHVKEKDLQSALEAHQESFLAFAREMPSDKWDYAYAPGKWTVKEVVQHLIDGERIFAYRALRFARMDDTPLPGFDENLYATTAHASKRNKEDLLKEMELVQKSSVALFESFDEEQLDAQGTANESFIYVKAIGFIIAGHTLHHMHVIRDRYL